MNEDEFAEFLDRGGGAADRGGTSTGEPAARLRDLLADESVWAEPTSDGVEDLLAAIEAESAVRPAAGARLSPAPARRGAVRRGALIALSAAAALVVVVVGAVAIASRTEDEGTAFDVAGTELAPEASAVATVDERGSGVAIELDVRGPAPGRARHLLPGLGQGRRGPRHGGHVPHACMATTPSTCGRASPWTATRRSPSPCRTRAAGRSRRAASCSRERSADSPTAGSGMPSRR